MGQKIFGSLAFLGLLSLLLLSCAPGQNIEEQSLIPQTVPEETSFLDATVVEACRNYSAANIPVVDESRIFDPSLGGDVASNLVSSAYVLSLAATLAATYDEVLPILQALEGVYPQVAGVVDGWRSLDVIVGRLTDLANASPSTGIPFDSVQNILLASNIESSEYEQTLAVAAELLQLDGECSVVVLDAN